MAEELRARPPGLSGIETLELVGNDIGPTGLAVLLEHEAWLSNLRRLDLSGNPLGDEGIAVLAASPAVASLEILWLREVGLTDAGAQRLAESPHLRRLRQLVVSGPGNDLTEEGRGVLRSAFGSAP